MNYAVSLTDADVVIFLDEFTLPSRTWLVSLLRQHQICHDRGELCLVGSKIVGRDSVVVSAGLEFFWYPSPHPGAPRQGPANALLPARIGVGAKATDPRYPRPGPVQALSSASLLVSRSLLLTPTPFPQESTKELADAEFSLSLREAKKAIAIVASGADVTALREAPSTTAPATGRWRKAEEGLFADRWNTSAFLLTDFARFRENVSVVWDGYLNDCTGWASEAVSYVVQLERRLRFLAIVGDDNFCPGYPPHTEQALHRMRLTNVPPGSVDIWVSHKPPPSYPRFPYRGLLYYENRPPYVIGRSMIESSVLPKEWLENFARVDEVWVPSRFLLDVFSLAGIERGRLYHIPESVDVHFYSPEGLIPLPLPRNCSFNFLSVFKWEERKGWDVLLESFVQEFSASEGVCLFLQTYQFQGKFRGRTLDDIVREFVEARLAPINRTLSDAPPVEVLKEKLPKADMPRLYKAADAFVLPSRGEGWGLPMMEAMAMGLPTIATNYSGMLEFMTPATSYLLSISGMVAPNDTTLYKYEGMLWAQPSVTHLRQLMRHVVTNRAEAAQVGQRARAHIVANFSEERVSQLVLDRLVEVKRKLLATPSTP